MMLRRDSLLAMASCAAIGSVAAVYAQSPLPEAIRAPGETAVMTLYADGAQVYECKADQAGEVAWTFCEPVATLLMNGKAGDRHYVGRHWELEGCSIVQGRVSGRAPGANPTDSALLKLDLVACKGQEQLAAVSSFQRIKAKDGALDGACEYVGAFRRFAYSTDYVFLKT